MPEIAEKVIGVEPKKEEKHICDPEMGCDIPKNNNKINYTHLAKLTGLSARHITRVIKGQCKNPSFITISKISTAMGLSSSQELIDYITENKVSSKYNGGRVLDDNQIKEIMDLKGKLTTREAEEKFKVSRQTISNIWNSPTGET